MPEASLRAPWLRRVHPVLKQVHLYLGLLNLSIILVWGIVGLYVLAAGEDDGRANRVNRESQIPYAAPANATDRQIADEVYALVRPALAFPVPDFALRRSETGELRLDFYGPNGIVRVQVKESQRVLVVQELRNNFVRFLNNLHASTWAGNSPHVAMRLWTAYTEFSIWSLLAMALTGGGLWLLTRPGYGIALASAASGAAAFALLWVMVR